MVGQNQQYSARKFLKPAVYWLVGTIILCFCILAWGQPLRGRIGIGDGIASHQEILSALWVFIWNFGVPGIAVAYANLSATHWRELIGEKIYGFQGQIALVILAFLCIVTIIGVIWSVCIADYPVFLAVGPYPEGIGPLNHGPQPSTGLAKPLSTQMQRFFSILAPFLCLVMVLDIRRLSYSVEARRNR